MRGQAPDSQRRAATVTERDAGNDFRGEIEPLRAFLDHEQTPGACHRLAYRFDVERRYRQREQQFRRNFLTCSERDGRLLREATHPSKGNDT